MSNFLFHYDLNKYLLENAILFLYFLYINLKAISRVSTNLFIKLNNSAHIPCELMTRKLTTVTYQCCWNLVLL